MVDLRGFLHRLDEEGDLVHIEESLLPRFEISAMLRRFDGDKALIFEKVEGYGTKVVGGVCGTRQRILKALGVEAEAIFERLLHAVRNPTPCEVGDGPVKEVVEQLSLSDIPVLTHFEGDPGPYVTSGILYARSPDGSVENVSFHRLLVLDDRRMTLRIVPRHLYRIVQMAREAGVGSLDVSISIGLHPAVMFASASPTPFGTCEFEVANTLLGGGLRLTECEHVDALAPADAELVLEGRLRLDEEAVEGPFVDLSGTFDVERRQPVVEVVGVSFEKFREGDPKNVLMAVFAAHPSLKHAVVVDSDIDPFDMEQVEWAIATRFRGDEDLLVIPHVRVSSLDPASDQDLELGCKVGVDATRPLSKSAEDFMRAEIPVSDRVRELLDRYSGRAS